MRARLANGDPPREKKVLKGKFPVPMIEGESPYEIALHRHPNSRNPEAGRQGRATRPKTRSRGNAHGSIRAVLHRRKNAQKFLNKLFQIAALESVQFYNTAAAPALLTDSQEIAKNKIKTVVYLQWHV